MDINIRKLYEQDAEFNQFVKDCLISSVEQDDSFEDTLASLYSMYQTGVSEEQVSSFIAMNNKLRKLIGSDSE